MKKVLLITYYFEPANSVGTPRVVSWAKEFSKSGLHTTVVTRHWRGDETDWSDFLREDPRPVSVVDHGTYSVHYLPYKQYIPEAFSGGGLKRKFYHLIQFLSGRFSPEVNAHHSFKDYCRQLLQQEHFDAVLVSAPPHNLVRLAYELNKEFNIPFIVDFRDIWNNQLTFNQKDTRELRVRLMNQWEEVYIKKWLQNASLVTSVSPALIVQVNRLFKGKTAVITNGFEDYIFKPIRQTKPEARVFTFSSIGSIYILQDLTILIQALKKIFYETEYGKDIRLNFIGAKAVPEVADKLAKELHMFDPAVTGRIPRKELEKHYKDSHILFIPAWKNHRGIYTTKIFEYIGSGRTILAAPGDGDVVDHIIAETNTGYVANTVDEFVRFIERTYSEWKQNGLVNTQPNEEKLLRYSRENQASELAESIISILG